MHKEAVSYVLLVLNILVISIHFDVAEKSSTTCHQQMLCFENGFPTLFTENREQREKEILLSFTQT